MTAKLAVEDGISGPTRLRRVGFSGMTKYPFMFILNRKAGVVKK